MSWKATYGIGTTPRKAPIRYTGGARSAEGRTVAGCQRRLTTVGAHGGRPITISKRNLNGLSACRWLRAPEFEHRRGPKNSVCKSPYTTWRVPLVAIFLVSLIHDRDEQSRNLMSPRRSDHRNSRARPRACAWRSSPFP